MTPANPTTTPTQSVPMSGPEQNAGGKPPDADRRGKDQGRTGGDAGQQAGDRSRPSDTASKPGEPGRDAAIPLSRDEGEASQPTEK